MTIEERTAAREAQLLSQISEQRRLAHPQDYVYDKSQESFWDLKDGTLHGKDAVDASIPIEFWRVEVDEAPPPAEGAQQGRGRPRQRRERLIPPSRDIMRVENNQFCEGATWWPGKPQIVKDWFIDKDGFQLAPGRRIYNQYKPAPKMNGDAETAWPWTDHIKKLWPNPVEHEFFFDYCAHMLQRPEEKCNAAIVLSGTQGIGKDAALIPVREAIGQWNSKGIDPDQLFSNFKPWLQTLMLVVDEVRPTKDEFHASSMYNILKPMIVAPPNTLPLEDKHVKLRYIINVLRVFITTNDFMSMYIPPEDRRMFIMHSTLEAKWHELEDKPEYFIRLFAWFEKGGIAAVNAWLLARDLSKFNPKKQVEKTVGWAAISNTWDVPEDAIGLALERLGEPQIIFGFELLAGQFDDRESIVLMLRSTRKIGNRMQRSGYVSVRPADGAEKWLFNAEGKQIRSRVAFVKQKLLNEPLLQEMIADHGQRVAASSKAENNVYSLNKDKF
jgi:hypothetical protein